LLSVRRAGVNDEWEGKLELVARERPAVVSFTFGCPDAEIVSWLRGCNIGVWCTVTTPDEAQTAAAAGVDALVVQGGGAGGHQSWFDDGDATPIGLLSLLQLVRRVTDLPLIAAGIARGAGVAAALAAGASAAQVGSALMLTPEAGTSEAHRAAFAADAPTALTRAFTGRRARGIANRFMHDHDAAAPKGYPQVHYLTAPIRALRERPVTPAGSTFGPGRPISWQRRRRRSRSSSAGARKFARLADANRSGDSEAADGVFVPSTRSRTLNFDSLRRGHGFDVERLGCAATETIKRPDNSASQPTSRADHRRLRADPRRGWAPR